ncbi:hypothetical protein VTN31DRAFT_5351 [Thermomyces dupontii]|uniref:uncharacterized protein n=1 Tax=Talaromyces thermophilus TaxID=28565 RepID=UPI00374441E0
MDRMDISESGSPASPASPMSGQIALDQQQHSPKQKGPKRLLQGLQRISSSPSLVRRTRSYSAGYQHDRKASLSCVSLSSSNQCWGDPSTVTPAAPLIARSNSPSDASTPGSARVRVVGTLPNVSQATVPLPPEVRARSHSLLSEAAAPATVAEPSSKRKIDFWRDLPDEIKMRVLSYLTPKDLVRCSLVSKEWYDMCFDGQLWSRIDATGFYDRISADALLKIITGAGPFVRDLNLRGCVQLREKWLAEGERISDRCRNVINVSLEGCRVDKTAIQFFLLRNARLRHINLSGLTTVTNSAMKIIAQTCAQLETLNVSWCANVDAKGLRRVVQACSQLRDLRAGEIRGFDNEALMLDMFERNTLERLVIHRTDVTDESLKVLVQGKDPEIDVLTDRPIVPPRKLKHLDLHQCGRLTDAGVSSLAHNVPELQALQLSQCTELTDTGIVRVVRTTPQLVHLDMEDLDKVTNTVLQELAQSPCAERLEHLNISFCENISDHGMRPVLRSCPRLRSIDMDNTRISDLSLVEACSLVRRRGGYGTNLPRVGMRLAVFDCIHVTWAGVLEVLSSNVFVPWTVKNKQPIVSVQETTTGSTQDQHHNDETSSPFSSSRNVSAGGSVNQPRQQQLPYYPQEIIQLKCFYGWQMTVDEHTKRVLRGDLAAAHRLDRKWADYMVATEGDGTGGVGSRRRRRRAARLLEEDEEDPVTGQRRRRARSGGCVVM